MQKYINKFKAKAMKSDPAKLKRVFYIFTALFIVSSMLQVNMKGIDLTAVMGFALAAIMFNFGNQCETQILRKQVEAFINSRDIILEDDKEKINGVNESEDKETNNSETESSKVGIQT